MNQTLQSKEGASLFNSIMAVGKRVDMFCHEGEKNLLYALSLYVEHEMPPGSLQPTTLRELITGDIEKIGKLFKDLPPGHPASVHYQNFKQLIFRVRIGIIIGLRNRLDLLLKTRKMQGGERP